jgi:hypothetical protein
MKLNYRSIARDARNRAEQELAAGSDSRVRYAALELRTAMEALVYERVLLYESELPDAELATWQPRRVFEVLLELNPHADQSSSVAIAPESSLGVRSGPFTDLGKDRVISTKELKTYYDRLGSYLHAPTVQQARSGAATTPEQMRKRCQEVLGVIDQVLSSRVFSVDFKVVARMACVECKATVICRMPFKPDEGRTIDCTRCKASYRVEPKEGSAVTWTPLHHTLQCQGPGCTDSCVVWPREVAPGTHWVCKSCGGRNRFAIGITYDLPQTGPEAGRNTPPAAGS